MPASTPTGSTLAAVPQRLRDDRLVRSNLRRFSRAELIDDGANLVTITPGTAGPSVSGYGSGSARLVADLARDGALRAPLGWLDLPRAERLSPQACALLRVSPLPGWDWMVTDTAPDAPADGVVDRLDPVAEREAIDDCLAEANPGTSARPGGADELGWWGVRDGGRLLGVIGVTRRGGPAGGDSWHLHGLGVRPAARGRGLGSALTTAVTGAGFAAGVDWVSLGVWAANAPAIAIYHRLGFVTEHRRGSYQPVVVDAACDRACG